MKKILEILVVAMLLIMMSPLAKAWSNQMPRHNYWPEVRANSNLNNTEKKRKLRMMYCWTSNEYWSATSKGLSLQCNEKNKENYILIDWGGSIWWMHQDIWFGSKKYQYLGEIKDIK